MANSKLTITDLPNDLLFEVFDRLTVKEVLSIQTVNKKFHWCSKKWFASVDELFIYDKAFALQKSFGQQPFCRRDDEFTKNEQTLLPSIERMLSSFTGIQNVVFYSSCPSIGVSQLIQLINRCPNFKRFSLLLKDQFTDDDWSSLVEVIKHYDIYLQVAADVQQSISVDHLKQLFTTATRIKLVKFKSSDLFLKTIDLLDDSVRIEIYDHYFPQTVVDKQIRDLVARRVDGLEIDLHYFNMLECSRFPMLSDLHFRQTNRYNSLPTLSPVEFPRLKSLRFTECLRDGRLFSSFLYFARQLDQLEQLEFVSKTFVIGDQLMIDVLKKAPKLKKLLLSCDYPGEFSPLVFKKLFQSLSQAPIRLPQIVEVDMRLTKLTPDEFRPIINCLIGFANKKITETTLKLTFSEFGQFKQSEFEEKITTTLPRNVLIQWLLD